MKIATEIFQKNLILASQTCRNYIIDQTNVLLHSRIEKLQLFESFYKEAVVIVVSEAEQKKRMIKKEKILNKNNFLYPKLCLESYRNLQENFVLPDGEGFDSIIYGEIDEEKARKLVYLYNALAKKQIHPLLREKNFDLLKNNEEKNLINEKNENNLKFDKSDIIDQKAFNDLIELEKESMEKGEPTLVYSHNRPVIQDKNIVQQPQILYNKNFIKNDFPMRNKQNAYNMQNSNHFNNFPKQSQSPSHSNPSQFYGNMNKNSNFKGKPKMNYMNNNQNIAKSNIASLNPQQNPSSFISNKSQMTTKTSNSNNNNNNSSLDSLLGLNQNFMNQNKNNQNSLDNLIGLNQNFASLNKSNNNNSNVMSFNNNSVSSIDAPKLTNYFPFLQIGNNSNNANSNLSNNNNNNNNRSNIMNNTMYSYNINNQIDTKRNPNIITNYGSSKPSNPPSNLSSNLQFLNTNTYPLNIQNNNNKLGNKDTISNNNNNLANIILPSQIKSNSNNQYTNQSVNPVNQLNLLYPNQKFNSSNIWENVIKINFNI